MICLDSDCIIDVLHGKSSAKRVITRQKQPVVTTVINQFEVMFGIYNKQHVSSKEEYAALQFFASLPVLTLDDGVFGAKLMSMLMKNGNSLGQNDVLVAAILHAYACKSIITNNEKHYSRFSGLKIIGY